MDWTFIQTLVGCLLSLLWICYLKSWEKSGTHRGRDFVQTQHHRHLVLEEFEALNFKLSLVLRVSQFYLVFQNSYLI